MTAHAFTGLLNFLQFIFAFMKKHDKTIAMFILLFMWLFFWGNTMNPDYGAYSSLYTKIQNGVPMLGKTSMEPGFILMMKLSSLLGLNYRGFLILTTLCCYLLIHSTIKLYCNSYSYVYLLYFIYPYLIDVIQIRNFIGMSILIYSVRYLVDDGLNGKIKYVVLLLIATTIHRISIVYLPMMLIRSEKQNTFIYYLAICSILFSVIFILNDKNIPILGSYIEKFISRIGNGKYLIYLENKTNLGWILFCYLQISSFVMILFSKILYQRYIINSFDSKYNNITNKFINLMYYANLLLFIYMPLLIINVNCTRIIRNILILNYIVFSIVSSIIRDRDIKMLYNIFTIIYALAFFVILVIPQTEDIILSVICNNIIYSILQF